MNSPAPQPDLLQAVHPAACPVPTRCRHEDSTPWSICYVSRSRHSLRLERDDPDELEPNRRKPCAEHSALNLSDRSRTRRIRRDHGHGQRYSLEWFPTSCIV